MKKGGQEAGQGDVQIVVPDVNVTKDQVAEVLRRIAEAFGTSPKTEHSSKPTKLKEKV